MSGADEGKHSSAPPARRSKRPSLRVPVDDVTDGGVRSSELPAAAVAEAAVVVVRGASVPSEGVAGFDTGYDAERLHPAFGVDETSSPATRFDDVTLTDGVPTTVQTTTDVGLGVTADLIRRSSRPPATDGPTSDADLEARFAAESEPLGGAGGRAPSSIPPFLPEPTGELDVAVDVTDPVTSPGAVLAAAADPAQAEGGDTVPDSRYSSAPPPEADPADLQSIPAPAATEGGRGPATDRAPAPHAVPPPPPADARKAPMPPAPPPPVPRESRQVVPVPTDPSKRPWFESFFDDDYLRTVHRPAASAVASQCDFIEEQLGLNKGARILDVGCGLGLQAVELAKRGYQVTALDLSESMLRRAKSEALVAGVNVTFVHGDMRQLHLEGRFDAVLCWGTTFGYFDDELNRRTMDVLHGALKPLGVLLMEVVNRDYVIQSQPHLVWFEGDGCVCIEETSVNYITSRLLVKRTVIRDDGHQYENFYSVRLYSVHELGQLMHHRGFKVLRVSAHESIPGVFFGADSPRMIILAERRVTQAHTIRDTVREPGKRESLINRDAQALTAAPQKPSSVPPPPQQRAVTSPPAVPPPTPSSPAEAPRSSAPPPPADKEPGDSDN